MRCGRRSDFPRCRCAMPLQPDVGASLKPELTALGMGIVFTPAADFTGIASGGIEISEVEQQAFVDVNEQGTTAAAVTTVTATVSDAPARSFTADRPFLFVIRERLSGAILFMGELRKPPAT